MLPLRRNFAPRDLLPLMDKSGVDATIIVQCRHDHAESSDLLAIAATHDFVAGVVGWVDLQAEDVSRQIAALRARPGGGRLVGIRHNVHDEPDADWLRRPTVRRGVSAVVDAGLTFDLLVRPRTARCYRSCPALSRGALRTRSHGETTYCVGFLDSLAHSVCRNRWLSERLVQSFGPGYGGELDRLGRGRFRRLHEPRARELRPGPPDLRLRLASLHACRNLPRRKGDR